MSAERWHQMDNDSVLKKVESSMEGLSDQQVKARYEKYGYNELTGKKDKPVWKMFLEQFKDVLVIILLIAAVISGALGEVSDTIVIMIVVLLNAVLGTIQENRAEKSLAALKRLAAPVSMVRRNGQVVEIPSRELVPGDIVLMEAGRFVPADCRIIHASNFKVEESSLTGESVPVEKSEEVIASDCLTVGDRKNMIFMSSMATYGRAEAVVVETGMDTEIGKIAKMIQEDDNTLTPLQIKLAELGKLLGILSLGVCVIMFIVGIITGKGILSMFMTSVSLAVAAIPEGLPTVVTIVLAIGVQKMIKRNAIIRKLPAVETLGCATVICSDKTGTLTQNKMTVMKAYVGGKIYTSGKDILNSADAANLMNIISLCNDTKVVEEGGVSKTIGDPTETALVDFAIKYGTDKRELDLVHKRVDEIPFDSERKLMTTINDFDGKLKALVKGAPDILIERCKYILSDNEVRIISGREKEAIRKANEDMAKDALRVLAAAYKDMDSLPEHPESAVVERDLVFAGLVGMIDPPREEVKEAVKICKSAGIRPVMITGDHQATAAAIAKELGILDGRYKVISGTELDSMSDKELERNIESYSVYARVSPEHKVKIVKAWQARGEIVAMTGDGVNDAPALKKADIGAAMGITGTDVAKEAADMVLTDDNFSTIVSAVEEGRTIFSNIRKSIHFLLSCNIGEIITLFTATMLGWAEPLIPIQILWVNLVTDSLPALALGMDPAEKGVMNREPRNPRSGIFSDGLGIKIGLGGVVIGLLALTAYRIGLNYNLEIARTMTFIVLSLSQLVHANNTRSDDESIFSIGLFSNKYLVTANICSSLLQLIVVFIPFLRGVFKVVPLNGSQWITVMLLSLMPVIIVEIYKAFNRVLTVKRAGSKSVSKKAHSF